MNYIPKHHYIDDAPNSLEDSPIRIDHADCSAGIDTKGRLYIWRKEDQSISAYCHNCGLSGYVKTNDHVRNIHKLRQSKRGKSNIVSLPRDMNKDPKSWPLDARAWVYSAGLTNEEVIAYGLGYSRYINRVIIPCFDSTGLLLGLQSRRLSSEDGPKYITRVRMDKKLMFCSRDNPGIYKPTDHGTCVIVEDALSCIKVGRTHHSLAVMGCYAGDQIINHLTKYYTNVIIFLDNDNHEVKKKQEELRRELDLVMTNVIVIKHDKDPKNCTNKELKELLK